MYPQSEKRVYSLLAWLLLAIIVTLCKATMDVGVPLPEVCRQRRGDRTVPASVSRTCADTDKVRRFFFHPTKHCKKFSLCPSAATYLDQQTNSFINYFQNTMDCKQTCTNVVECPEHPLREIENGYPVLLQGEGESEGDVERYGYGARVTFACNTGYRLVEESTRTCRLNGTWSGKQSRCEIQCPKPESLAQNVSISPLQPYYNIGQKVQLDCMDGMDGNATLTCIEQGTWEGRAPTCTPSCAPPVVDNAYPPETVHPGVPITYTYRCYKGYTMLHNSSNLTCTNGQLHGVIPLCTRVQIQSDGTPVHTNNGTFYFEMEEGPDNHVLTCGRDGIEQDQYNISWILPKKPNGEVPPSVTANRNTLVFSRALPEQEGKYICSTAGTNVSVIVDVITPSPATMPPRIEYFYPGGVFKSSPGATKVISSLIVGSQPLLVTWQHNGTDVINNSSIHNTQFTVNQFDDSNTIFSQLTINGVGEVAQGVYKIVANNGAGRDESREAQLMLAGAEAGRRKRGAPFCNEDPGKVVLVGVMRRTGKTKSGLRTIRLRVNRILRGDANGISRRSVEVHIFSGTVPSRLRRGQSVILSGVPRGEIVYMFDTPIEDYSSSLEQAIIDC